MPQIVDRGQLPIQAAGMFPLAQPQAAPALTREGNAGDFFADILSEGLLSALSGAITKKRRLTPEGQRYMQEAPLREARHADWKRSKEKTEFEQEQTDRPRKQQQEAMKSGLDLMFRLNNEQRSAADQEMQTQRFAWDREDRDAERQQSAAKLAQAQQERAQWDAANTALADTYANSIGKVGGQYRPEDVEAARAAAKVMEPSEYRMWAKDFFETAAGGGDTAKQRAQALSAYGEMNKATLEADAEIAKSRIQETDARLRQLIQSEGDPDEIDAMRGLLRKRRNALDISTMKSAYAWNPDLGSRSMTQYNQLYSPSDPSGWIESRYLSLAEREFESNYGRFPQTPDEIEMVKALAREWSTQGGWEP